MSARSHRNRLSMPTRSRRRGGAGRMVCILLVAVLVVDQALKLWVKTHMYYGEDIELFSWWHIRFIENNGMAFGWQFISKYLLTAFRLVAIVLILIYLINLVRQRQRTFILVCVTLILAGAIGNVIDCLFYGLLFNSPRPPMVASFVGWGVGYAPLMLGRVVDMLYFPLLEWDMPGWSWLDSVPFLPGSGAHCIFFSPIFNVADAAVSCGIIALLIYFLLPHRR